MSEGIIPEGSAQSPSGSAYLEVNDLRDGTNRYPNLVIPESISDDELSDMITDASTLLDSATGDHFLPTTGTIVVDGPRVNGYGRTGRLLLLPRRVRSVSAVSQIATDGTTLSAYDVTTYRVHSSLIDPTTTDTPTYFGNKGMDAIEFLYGPSIDSITLPPSPFIVTGAYPTYPRAVAVAGTFDWATTPEPIKKATALIVLSWANTMVASPKAKSYTSGRAQFQMNEEGFTGITEVDRTIAQYRRAPVPLQAV